MSRLVLILASIVVFKHLESIRYKVVILASDQSISSLPVSHGISPFRDLFCNTSCNYT